MEGILTGDVEIDFSKGDSQGRADIYLTAEANRWASFRATQAQIDAFIAANQ